MDTRDMPKETIDDWSPEYQKQYIEAVVVRHMVYVEAGTFVMGALANDNKANTNEQTRHRVTLSSFYISKYEVNQSLWEFIMGINPSYCQNFFGTDVHPVESVSWQDCQEFLKKLNSYSIRCGYRFRLPTEAEWEYAARGGKKSRGYIYSGSNNIDDVAWYEYNSGGTSHEVGKKKPNELGLYDMTGNVLEWCQDWYGEYGSQNQNNPTGPSSGSRRINRGGSWYDGPQYCRISYHDGDSPETKLRNIGLRLVMEVVR